MKGDIWKGTHGREYIRRETYGGGHIRRGTRVVGDIHRGEYKRRPILFDDRSGHVTVILQLAR